ncbi:MAG TPA: proton-conducting transporter membrane subunit, partial [Propionicimonas sp.]|nr:proton-conducting transporter membrane subunit [Propionicimonas sp.]
MTLVGAGLLLVLCAAGSAPWTAMVSSARKRGYASGVMTCVVGLGGVLAGAGALLGGSWSVTATRLLPLSRAELAVDPLSGIFVFLVGAVALATGVYSMGYPQAPEPSDGVVGPAHGTRSRTAHVALPLFAAAMVLVPTAGNVTTFLVLWELMALVSLVLVLTEHRSRPEVGQAGIWYAAMTHAGLVAILLALVILSAAAGGESFVDIREAASGLSSGTRSLVFVLAFVGFGSKAGLVPLHVWLPRAHPEAPSYVSALMSAAMVNLGVYGVLRVGFDLLGGGPRWWWLLVLAAGVVSALSGVLQAMAATDLKRLLAYSTTENL